MTTGIGPWCFSFWYLAFGEDFGRFQVMTKSFGQEIDNYGMEIQVGVENCIPKYSPNLFKSQKYFILVENRNFCQNSKFLFKIQNFCPNFIQK